MWCQFGYIRFGSKMIPKLTVVPIFFKISVDSVNFIQKKEINEIPNIHQSLSSSKIKIYN